MVDADYLDHVAFAGQAPGIAGVRQRVATLLGSLDPQWTIHDLVGEDDLVMVRWTLTGTHRGTFLGVPATGRPISFNGIDIYRVTSGKLNEHWNVVDMLEFYRQAGMMAGPDPANAYSGLGHSTPTVMLNVRSHVTATKNDAVGSPDGIRTHDLFLEREGTKKSDLTQPTP